MINFLHEVFKNAPIVEALLDIQVEVPESTPYSRLDDFYAEIKDIFPHRHERKKVDIEFSAKDEEVRKTVSKIGFSFKSESFPEVVQARLTGFSFSRLKPYKNWPKLRDDSGALWQIYREILKPDKVTKLGLRYINRIEIPLPMSDLDEYVLTNPKIAPSLPQDVNDIFMRLVIPDVERDSVGVVILTIDEMTPESKTLPLIFDIDVFKYTNFEAASDEIWQIFESLCAQKNELFFHSVTEKAKGLWR